MFFTRKAYKDIYLKLLSDKLNINPDYLFENIVAQMITASKRNLYYHTWQKKESTHHYEIDFLFSKKGKIVPLEIKSNSIDFMNQ